MDAYIAEVKGFKGEIMVRQDCEVDQVDEFAKRMRRFVEENMQVVAGAMRLLQTMREDDFHEAAIKGWTSYWESTIRCLNHENGCESTLIVCGEDVLNSQSLHADCVESCGWEFRYADNESGILCPRCASRCKECGNYPEDCWCNEASYDGYVEDQ